MKGFKKGIALVVVGGFLFGASTVAMAWDVPGWDIPYNPPAYYDPNTPDPEDSPSPFFYRDLASQGMLVYDPNREKQHIEVVKNWQGVLDTVLEKLKLNNLNLRMLSSDNFATILYDAFGINNDVDSKNKVIPMMNEVTTGSTIRATDRYDDYEREYSIPDKLKLDQAAAANTLDFAKVVLNDNQKRQSIQQKLVQDMARAEGTNEQLQVENYLQYQNNAARYRKLELSSNTLGLLVQELFSEIDDDLADSKTKMTFKAVDPTNMDDYQKEHYKPRKPLGFPDFE